MNETPLPSNDEEAIKYAPLAIIACTWIFLFQSQPISGLIMLTIIELLIMGTIWFMYRHWSISWQLIKFILIILFVYWIGSGITKNWGKYEGMTAEEWFNEYDAENQRYEELKNCIEDYSYSEDYDDLIQIQDCIIS